MVNNHWFGSCARITEGKNRNMQYTLLKKEKLITNKQKQAFQTNQYWFSSCLKMSKAKTVTCNTFLY